MTLYVQIGGSGKLRELVDLFYDFMDTKKEAADIRAMHPKNLKYARDKLFMFLSGVFGGPNLYMEKYGHPRLRARHLPFLIGPSERDQWLFCMELALTEMNFEEELKKKLKEYFATTADHMVNQEKPDNPFNIIG